MGRNYSQLDLDERIELNCLRDAGCSKREIGRLTGAQPHDDLSGVGAQQSAESGLQTGTDGYHGGSTPEQAVQVAAPEHTSH